MKIALGGLWHETNTFSPTRTTVDDFRRFQYSEGPDVVDRNRGVANEIGGFIDAGSRLGFQLEPLVFAGALPSATVSGDAYRLLRKPFLQRLHSALPLDGLLLALHGAMVVEGVDDVEGELLADARKIVGSTCPIVATIDLHANLSEDAFQIADVIVGYDTYPHEDILARACEAAEILNRLVRGMKVRRSFCKLPLLTVPQAQGTSDEPMRSIMRRCHEWERNSQIVSATVVAGYPYSDVARLGMTVVAYGTPGPEVAKQCTKELAHQIWMRRDQFTIHNTAPPDAVRQAMSAVDGPVVLVDVADNIGGGSPGDGTVLLCELLAQGAVGAVVTLVDPEGVSAAIAAGIDKQFEFKAGGKVDSFHGDPIPVRGTVRTITDGVYTHRGSYMPGLRVEMGRTAVVVSNGVEIVLMEQKAMPFDAEQLRCVGIEPACRKIIAVKSAIAWKAAYGEIAKRTIYVDTPGLCSSNLSRFQYRKAPRPVYPLDPDTTYDD